MRLSFSISVFQWPTCLLERVKKYIIFLICSVFFYTIMRKFEQQPSKKHIYVCLCVYIYIAQRNENKLKQVCGYDENPAAT